MKRKFYTKPSIVKYGMETIGSLMAGSGETKMEMEWLNDGNGGRNADPKSEVLSKEHDGSSGLWDDND